MVRGAGRKQSSRMPDSRMAIVREGLPWFSRFESLEDVLTRLTEAEELREVHTTRTSPARRRMIGYLARRLGLAGADQMIAEAESELKEMMDQVYSLGRKRKMK